MRGASDDDTAITVTFLGRGDLLVRGSKTKKTCRVSRTEKIFLHGERIREGL